MGPGQRSAALVERLLNGVPCIHPPPGADDVSSAFYDAVHPLMTALGSPCDLVEVYTVERRSRHVAVSGVRIIIFDRAQLEWLECLERLLDVNAPGFIAAALQRLLAEASRCSEHALLYRFFINRAGEVSPLSRALHSLSAKHSARRWQIIVLLLHEAGHSLPPGHQLRDTLEVQARLSASMMVNEQIAALSMQLDQALQLDVADTDLLSQIGEWSILRDDLKLGNETIAETLFAVGGDPRFLEEIACDAFAIANVGALLKEEISSLPAAAKEGRALTVLTVVARAFLHLRLLSYVDELIAGLPEHLVAAKVNPLKLRFLVELSFRRNLVVRQLIDVASEIGGAALSERFRETMLREQARHADRLLSPANELFEQTLLDPKFHRRLPALLDEDGWDATELTSDWTYAFEATDESWRSLVLTSISAAAASTAPSDAP